jgi:hypothetical protein
MGFDEIISSTLSNLSIQILLLFICASLCAHNSKSSQFCNPCTIFGILKYFERT